MVDLLDREFSRQVGEDSSPRHASSSKQKYTSYSIPAMVWDLIKTSITNINTMKFVLKLTVALLAASASGAQDEPDERAFLRGGFDEDWDESVRHTAVISLHHT